MTHRPNCSCQNVSVARVGLSLIVRFATAAEAIRFAVEDFPAIRTLGAWMQVGDERFDSDDIGACTRVATIRAAAARGS